MQYSYHPSLFQMSYAFEGERIGGVGWAQRMRLEIILNPSKLNFILF